MNCYELTGFNNHLDLQIEREIRGISLEEISRDSRFSINQLKDFEAKRFDRLPNEIVLRSMINLYIRKLGLDPDMVRLEYSSFMNHPGHTNVKKRALKKLVQDIQIGPLIGFFLITLALLIFLWPLKLEKIFQEPVANPADLVDDSVGRSEAMHFFDMCFRNKISFYPDLAINDEVVVVAVQPGDLLLSVIRPTWIRIDDVVHGINSLHSLFPGEKQIINIQDETIVRFENPDSVSITQFGQGVFWGDGQARAIQFVPDKIPDIMSDDTR